MPDWITTEFVVWNVILMIALLGLIIAARKILQHHEADAAAENDPFAGKFSRVLVPSNDYAIRRLQKRLYICLALALLAANFAYRHAV